MARAGRAISVFAVVLSRWASRTIRPLIKSQVETKGHLFGSLVYHSNWPGQKVKKTWVRTPMKFKVRTQARVVEERKGGFLTPIFQAQWRRLFERDDCKVKERKLRPRKRWLVKVRASIAVLVLGASRRCLSPAKAGQFRVGSNSKKELRGAVLPACPGSVIVEVYVAAHRTGLEWNIPADSS